MWSVNTSPNPGLARTRSRSAGGTGSALARTSKAIPVLGLAVMTGSFVVTSVVISLSSHRRALPARYTEPRPGRPADLSGYPRGDVVADLGSDPRRPGSLPLDQVVGHGLLDAGRLGGQAQVVAQHGRGQDGRGRVGLLLAGNVRRAAVHRLEHARGTPLRVDVPARGEPDTPGHRRPQVGEDVTEEVVGHHHVEAVRLADEEHRGGVDVEVVHRNRA